jgi:hypothetical protein
LGGRPLCKPPFLFHGLLQELPPNHVSNDLGDKRWHRISKHALHVIATAVDAGHLGTFEDGTTLVMKGAGWSSEKVPLPVPAALPWLCGIG